MSSRSFLIVSVSSVAFAAASLAGASSARADTPVPSFEGRGQVVLSDLLGVRTNGLGYLSMLTPSYTTPVVSGFLGYAHQEDTMYQMGTGATMKDVREVYTVSPAVDVFVSKHVTLGAALAFGKSDVTDTYVGGSLSATGNGQSFLGTVHQSSTLFGVAPRVGYAIPLGHGFSLWPRVGVAYSRAQTTAETNWAPGSAAGPLPYNSGSLASSQWTAGADVGVVFRPTEHVYFSAAPEVSVMFNHFEQYQPNSSFYSADSFAARFAGTLSMGVILGS